MKEYKPVLAFAIFMDVFGGAIAIGLIILLVTNL